MCAPCPQRSPPRLLTDAACGGLEPPPAGRLRRANLHLWRNQHPLGRSSTSIPPSAFVAHDRQRSAQALPNSGLFAPMLHPAHGAPHSQAVGKSASPGVYPSPSRTRPHPPTLPLVTMLGSTSASVDH